MSNFRGEATNFRGEATNFRGAMSNFRGEATNFRAVRLKLFSYCAITIIRSLFLGRIAN